MMNFYPKNYKQQWELLNEIKGHISDIESVDFSRMIDPSIEGAESFANEAEKAVSKVATDAAGACQSLKNEFLSEFYDDFLNHFTMYTFVVENKLEEEHFPFPEWYSEARDLKEYINFKHEDIFPLIKRIAVADEYLGRYNLAYYLSPFLKKEVDDEKIFSNLERLIKESFPKVDFLNVLSATKTLDIFNALGGQEMTPSTNSRLLLQYAAALPNSNWTFIDVFGNGKNPKPKELIVHSSTTDFEKVFEAFSKTEVWKKINVSQELREAYVHKLIDWSRNSNQFYKKRATYYANRTMYTPSEIKWENARAFVKHVLKDDMKSTELLVSKLIKLFPDSQTEELMIEGVKVLNIALYFNLDKEMPVGENKVKKAKI